MKKTLYEKLIKVKYKFSLRGFFEVSSTIFIFGTVAFSLTYLMPNTKVVKAEVLQKEASQKEATLEVHIANNGMVYIQGAKVLAVNATTLTVGTSWQNLGLRWLITTNGSNYGKRHFGTEFYNSKGKAISVNEIKVGDNLVVSGDLDTKHKELVVKASVVRLLSI